ncbi:MAG: FlgD immunoglobulin-like domain containing protein [Chloroflexota bacterium]
MTDATTAAPTRRRLLAAVAAACIVLVATTVPAAARREGRPWQRLTVAQQEARVAASISTKKAVVVVGPVGSATRTYIRRGEAIPAAAEAKGMAVVRLYHPQATWERVVAEANGADLFVYLGHGNGWPSPYGPFQEDTKNGLGLTPRLGTTDDVATKYVGADHIREEIRFAPNAIVLFSGLCYASGNAEEGMPIPSLSVARQRVDNYAAGFLDAGARTVIALGWQPGATLVGALASPDPVSMHDWFRMRFGSGSGPYYGWVGAKPGQIFPSERVAGAFVRLDPDPDAGYLRGMTGDHTLTNIEWLGAGDPGDTIAPEIDGVSGLQADDTIPAGEDAAPVFTPNRDGLSDAVTIRYTLSEPAFVVVRVRRPNDTEARRFTFWSEAGPGTFTWNGRTDTGKVAADGRYRIEVQPRDRSGNEGASATVAVRLLTAIARPVASAELFHAADADTLAPETTFSVDVRHAALVGWRVTAEDGSVVRRSPEGGVEPGTATWTWDGRDDAGALVPTGRYTAIVTATTEDGSYSHALRVRQMPYDADGDWTVQAGEAQRFTIESAEPIDGLLVVTVKQPRMPAYTLRVRRDSETLFSARWVAREGRAGRVRITITGTDTAGGTQTRVYTGTIGAS